MATDFGAGDGPWSTLTVKVPGMNLPCGREELNIDTVDRLFRGPAW
jgi:hypothetical protein